MSARPLYKTDEVARLKERVVRLERCLADQKRKATEWERAATRYHALLLQARVELIRERKPPLPGEDMTPTKEKMLSAVQPQPQSQQQR